MERKVISGIMLTLLLISTLTLAVNIQSARAETSFVDMRILSFTASVQTTCLGQIIHISYTDEVTCVDCFPSRRLDVRIYLGDVLISHMTRWVMGNFHSTGSTRFAQFSQVYIEPGEYMASIIVDGDDDPTGNMLTYGPIYVSPLMAAVNVRPETLNLRSKGKWITAYIELPEYRCNVSDIDVSTIMLNSIIPVDSDAPAQVGDYDNDTVQDLMVRFDRTVVSKYILSQNITHGNVTLTITGKHWHGLLRALHIFAEIPFEGSDTIRVKDG